MSDQQKNEKKVEPAIEQTLKPRDYFQKPALPADTNKSIGDTSGSEWAGQKWSGRSWGGGRSQ